MSTVAGNRPGSPYQRRLQLVVDTIEQHENLGAQESRSLAVHVLHAIDHIPEHIR